nr:MAG TPA: hypothetical protein [Bacteriophage sp.]
MKPFINTVLSLGFTKQEEKKERYVNHQTSLRESERVNTFINHNSRI